MLHIPILRWGTPYERRSHGRSHFRTREPFVEVSQANVGLIRRDLLRQAGCRATLATFRSPSSCDMSQGRGRALPARDAADRSRARTTQTPQEYVEQVSATTGMPWANVRRNMRKVHGVLSRVDEVLSGLTRGLDLAVLDEGPRPARRPHGELLPARRRARASCCRATRLACTRSGRRPRC